MTAIALPWASTPRRIVTERPSDERDLVLAAQRGVREAFSELVRRHQRRAYAVARSIVVNHEDAEDAVQEAFLHAYKAIDRFLHGLAAGGRGVAKVFDVAFDRALVDGSVNTFANWTWDFGLLLRRLQTGSLRQYVLFIVMGTWFMCLAYFAVSFVLLS